MALERHSSARPRRSGRRRFFVPLRPRVLAAAGFAAAVLVAVVLAFALGGGEPAPTRGYEVAMKPLSGSGATATATLHSVDSGTTLHLSASDLAGDRARLRGRLRGRRRDGERRHVPRGRPGHAYAVLQTALRRGEYDGIRVVRKQRDSRATCGPRRPRGAAPNSDPETEEDP